MSRRNSINQRKLKVRVNTVLSGEPAIILLELKARGLVLSNTDALVQGLLALRDKVLKRDLEVARLRTIEQTIGRSGEGT